MMMGATMTVTEPSRDAVRRWIRDVLDANPNLTLEGWAKKGGVDKSSMSRLARGEMGVRVETLWRLAHAVGVAPPMPAAQPLTIQISLMKHLSLLEWVRFRNTPAPHSQDVVMVPPVYAGCFAFAAERPCPAAFVDQGDLLIVDPAKQPADGSKVLAATEASVDIYQRTGDWLVPLGKDHPISIDDATAWPIVAVIRRL